MRLAGGFIVPLHTTERLCIDFKSPNCYMFAIKATSDGECLLTALPTVEGLIKGTRWDENGCSDLQNYLPFDLNKRIESRYLGDGHYQPLMVEKESLMIELEIYPLRSDRWKPPEPLPFNDAPALVLKPGPRTFWDTEFTLPKIYLDGHVLEICDDLRRPNDYDQNTMSRIRLHLVTVEQWEAITGKPIEYPPLTK